MPDKKVADSVWVPGLRDFRKLDRNWPDCARQSQSFTLYWPTSFKFPALAVWALVVARASERQKNAIFRPKCVFVGQIFFEKSQRD